MSNHKTAIVTIALGLASGVLGTLIAQTLIRPEKIERREAAPQAPILFQSPVVSSADGKNEARLSALELAMRQRNAALQPMSNDAGLDVGFTPEVIEARREAELQAWDDMLDKHDAEPVDPAWAPVASKRLGADIASITSQSGFKLVDVQCKSKTCSAQVQWSDFQKAAGRYTELLHHHYQDNCRREILLPQPDDDSAPYQATILFECSKGAATGS